MRRTYETSPLEFAEIHISNLSKQYLAKVMIKVGEKPGIFTFLPTGSDMNFRQACRGKKLQIVNLSRAYLKVSVQRTSSS